MRVCWVIPWYWLWCCLRWIRPSTWGGGLRSWTPILWFTLSSLGRNPKRRSSTNSDDYLETLQRFRKVWYLHYLTPRSSIIQGAIIWKEFGLECCNVVISEISARIYKSFSFSGSGSWIWLLLCVLSMCAYNSSRVESADSEMIPPFQIFQSHSNPANSAGPSSTSRYLQRSQFQQLCFSLWAEKHQAMTRVATPSYYVFPEDDYEYQ